MPTNSTKASHKLLTIVTARITLYWLKGYSLPVKCGTLLIGVKLYKHSDVDCAFDIPSALCLIYLVPYV